MRRLVPATIVFVVALLAFAAVAFAQETPSVSVQDQAVTANEVIVSSVVYTGPGWIAIHKDDNGKPGAVVGHSAVKAGTNEDVTVLLDETPGEGDKLWVMLHTDAGTEGTYEFPGPDAPVMENGQIVMEQFTVTGGAAAQAAQATPTVTATAAAAPAVTATQTTTAPATLPTTGGAGGGGFPLLLSLGLLALGVLLIVGAFVLRPRAR
ncbi:MAG: hypothetical protein M5U01_27580 [Ardenticatenaceae bacterium]|nr:hypothetical protein [Ardenticatenaceae bacterium]